MGSIVAGGVAGGLAALVVGGAIAVAAVPGKDGTISACFDSASGALRVQDVEDGSPRRCTSKETPLAWERSWDGTATSPNGLYAISVTDAGLELRGPAATVLLDATGARVTGTAVTVQASGTATVQGAAVRLNGCAAPLARRGDAVTGVVTGSAVTGTVAAGSATVCAG